MAVQLGREDPCWAESQSPEVRQHEAFEYLIQIIAEQLRPEDVRSIVHRQKLPVSQQQRGETPALEALMQLERRGLFSAHEIQPLADLLSDVRRDDLVDQHVAEYRHLHGTAQQSSKPNPGVRNLSLKLVTSGGKSQSQSFPPQVRYRVKLPRQSSAPASGIVQEKAKPSPQKVKLDIQPAFLLPPRKAQPSTLSGDRVLQVPQLATKPHPRHHSEPPGSMQHEDILLPTAPRTSTPKSTTPTSSLLDSSVLPDHIPSQDHLFEAGSRSETSLSTSTSSIEFYNMQGTYDNSRPSSANASQEFAQGPGIEVAPSLYSIPNSDPNWFDESAGRHLTYHSEGSLVSETSELQIADQSADQYNPLSPNHTPYAQGTSLQTMCGSFEEVPSACQNHHGRFNRVNSEDHHKLHTSANGAISQQHGATQSFKPLADTRRWGSDESSYRDGVTNSRNRQPLSEKAQLTNSLGSYGPLSVVRSEMQWLIKRNDLNKAIYEHKAGKFFTSPNKLDVDVGGKANPKFIFHLYPYGLEEDVGVNATLEVEIWYPKSKKYPRLPNAVNVYLSVTVWDCETGDCMSSCDAEVSMNLRRYTIQRFITHTALKESRSNYIEIQASSELLEPPPSCVLGTRL